mmetsp:Transcript_13943/g.29789  ORF Transcript_13943/g.29789 Transcript_13943/m.29789 type:complete len:326 (-) Transcript_13943:983-1960(-)
MVPNKLESYGRAMGCPFLSQRAKTTPETDYSVLSQVSQLAPERAAVGSSDGRHHLDLSAPDPGERKGCPFLALTGNQRSPSRSAVTNDDDRRHVNSSELSLKTEDVGPSSTSGCPFLALRNRLFPKKEESAKPTNLAHKQRTPEDPEQANSPVIISNRSSMDPGLMDPCLDPGSRSIDSEDSPCSNCASRFGRRSSTFSEREKPSSSVFILQCDSSYVIRDCDDNACVALRCTRSELIGLPIVSLMSPLVAKLHSRFFAMLDNANPAHLARLAQKIQRDMSLAARFVIYDMQQRPMLCSIAIDLDPQTVLPPTRTPQATLEHKSS